MHLIFERYKGRFRSNCNILALAWAPYYQECKFRQALYDYHQKQLISVARSTLNAGNQLQRLDDRADARDSNNNHINIVSSAAASPIGGDNSANGHENARDGGRADTAAIGGKVFPNARLAEQYQRHVLSISEPSRASIEHNQRKASDEALNYAGANDELDARYGRMADFGWLAIGNIGKIIGVTLTSTVPPPNEIDGRKLANQEADDLILLDDSEPLCSDAQTNKDSVETSSYERLRPDRKCARSNYNLRGHLDEIILVKWNELYQKLATVDSKGNVLIWCKVNEKFTIQTPFYNRSKSVADFKWSNDGKTALICFTDSFILVGSSTSQRHWHSMLNLDDYHITCASWAPNDEQLLLGVSNGNVVVIDLPHSQLTELVVGVSHIRAMCWSSSEMNLRHMREQDSDKRGQDQASSWSHTSAFTSPSEVEVRSSQSTSIVSQRRLSRDCSVFSRYRFCSQGPVNGNCARDAAPNSCAGVCRGSSRKGSVESHKNILAMDFANNTIKLFDGGLNDPKPLEIEVHLESYLMAWSSDGKVLAVAGFNISTSAAPPHCVRCKYLNHIKFYNQQGGLILNLKLKYTRYPITALTWAHNDQRLFLATGPRLHCARVYFGVPKLSLLAMCCVHRNTKYPNKVELLDSLFRQQKQRNRLQQHEHHYKNTSLLNWQSFNCPLELEHVLASSEKPLTSTASFEQSCESGFTASGAEEVNEQAVLKYNFNISNYQLPAKLKMAVDQLFLQTLRQPFDEHLTLADVAWHVPKNQQRCYCTLICYTHELVDIGCGATVGHQYKTQEMNEREGSSTGNHQTSDQFKIFVLYVEYQGSLVPILKARRIGVLKPEFVIFDPEEVSSKHYHRRQKVSDISNLSKLDPNDGQGARSIYFDRQQPHRLSSHNCSSLHEDPLVLRLAGFLDSSFNSSERQSLRHSDNRIELNDPPDRASSQLRVNITPASTGRVPVNPPQTLLNDPTLIHLLNHNRSQNHKRCVQGASRLQHKSFSRQEEARRMAIERYRTFAGCNLHETSSASKNLKTLPEKSELVRIRSNIWGTRFKVINVGNRMIAQRAYLCSLTYKASILHLQPRQIFLSMKDMSNYCILCSMHHHTRARNETSKLQDQSTTGGRCNRAVKSEISLIDLQIFDNTSDFVTPLTWAPVSRGNDNKRESSRISRERRNDDKVVLPVGDNIRVAPKLESHQRYKLSSRSSSSSRNCYPKTPSKSSSNVKAGQRLETPMRLQDEKSEPIASSSRSMFKALEACKSDNNHDEILTLSLDEGNHVQLGMVLNEERVSPKRSQASKQLDEFLEENKTLKSIQTITKMIVDLSSKAHDDEDTSVSANNRSTPFRPDEDNQTSPAKILKLSDQDGKQEIRSPSRYVPPETPVHRPRRVAVSMMGANINNGRASIKAQSVSSTPTRLSRASSSRGNGQRRIDRPSDSLMHADTPLPPPPPSVPFRRKLSSSAKRFFDGSLRSLTGASGYSTSEEPDDSGDCEPLMSRRDRRIVSKFNLARNQSQPCTPIRALSRTEPPRKQSIDLAQMKNQLLHRFRSPVSRSRHEERLSGSKGSARKGVSTSHLESSGCTKRSRWIHKDTLSGTEDSRGYSADSELDCSSLSSSTSSSSSSSDLLDVDRSVTDEKKREPRFMRHMDSMRSFGKKSAKSLTDLAKINSAESRAVANEQMNSRGQLNRESSHKRRPRRHNRKSICANVNCCCGKEFKLNNRPPVWNELSEVYQLDFGGRVTQESAKNLQIDFNGNLALQFGRIDRCTYTLDYKYPFNAVQAMSIALASLTQRLK